MDSFTPTLPCACKAQLMPAQSVPFQTILFLTLVLYKRLHACNSYSRWLCDVQGSPMTKAWGCTQLTGTSLNLKTILQAECDVCYVYLYRETELSECAMACVASATFLTGTVQAVPSRQIMPCGWGNNTEGLLYNASGNGKPQIIARVIQRFVHYICWDVSAESSMSGVLLHTHCKGLVAPKLYCFMPFSYAWDTKVFDAAVRADCANSDSAADHSYRADHWIYRLGLSWLLVSTQDVDLMYTVMAV